MADKIRFRLYRIPNPVTAPNDPRRNDTREIQSWQYILDKTEDDIDTSKAIPASRVVGVIQLSPENIIGARVTAEDLINPLPVYESNTPGDAAIKLIVYIRNDIYFLLRTQVARSLLDTIPSVIDFYVNPQRITFNKQKIITEVKTRGGWDIQHWGEKLTEINVEGITGGLHRDITRTEDYGRKGMSLQDGEDISKSSAWQYLRILRSVYDADHRKTTEEQTYRLGFQIYEDFYTGYFQNFNGPEIVADRPYLMTYSFTFKVEKQESDIPLRLENKRSTN